jgi:hypothetical protein
MRSPCCLCVCISPCGFVGRVVGSACLIFVVYVQFPGGRSSLSIGTTLQVGRSENMVSISVRDRSVRSSDWEFGNHLSVCLETGKSRKPLAR